MRRFPLSFLLCTGLGILCAIPGLVRGMAGFGDLIHPLLADEGAGLALVVSAVALIGSGLFPFVIARLRAAEGADPPDYFAGVSLIRRPKETA